jgi:chromosomal replication initiation ATPase DnaA
MQLVSYRNTMNGAKRFVDELDAERDEARKRRQIQRASGIRRVVERWEAEQAEIARKKEVLAKQRAEVAALMEKGRQAAKAFNDIDGLPLARIMERICRATGVSRHDIMSKRRNPRLILVRQAVMYWACRSTGMSTPQIGQLMGRDHSTLIHGKKIYIQKRAEMGRTLRAI